MTNPLDTGEQPPQSEDDWLDEILARFEYETTRSYMNVDSRTRKAVKASAKQAIIEGLRERLPKKKPKVAELPIPGELTEDYLENQMALMDELNGYTAGFNAAIDQVNQLLNELGGKL